MTIPVPFLTPTEESQFIYSGVRYRPAAGTTKLALTTEAGREIGYLERGHIFVWKSVNGFVTAIPLVRPDDYNFDATGTGIILVEPTLAGDEYALVRDTPLEPYIVFADGATLTAEQLNRLARVNLYRDQEQADAFASGGGGGGGGGGPGGGGTVVRVVGGAGLTGDITVSGSLNVGAGTGISALTDAVAINRTQVDSWYASFGHGHNAATPTVPGFMSAADKTILDGLAAGPGVVNLDSLSDVTVSGPVRNEVLLYDGTTWKNSLPGGDIGAIPFTINRDYSAFTTGTVSSGQIAFDNNMDWTKVKTAWIHYTDSVTSTSNETALRVVGAGSILRVAHNKGTFEFTVATRSFAGSTATYGVTPGVGNIQFPNNGSAMSVTLNGTQISGGAIELNQLNDVTLTSPANDQILKFNNATKQWINAAVPAGGGATNLDGLTDVVITTPASTQILQFNGTNWVNAAAPAGGGATNLDGLTDVVIAAPATDQVLRFNGTNWVNAAAPGGGGGTVTQVDGGAGLTGTVTTTGSLAVGAGTGISVSANAVAVDRTVVDTWYAPAGGGGGVTAVTGTAPIVSSGGAAPAISIVAATASVPGSMSAADKTKLDAMATNAQLRDRATHTGTQAASTISDFTASSRAQVEATLTASTGITLTPTGSGATRSIAIAAAGGGGGATNLDGLTDVTIGTPAELQMLQFTGGAWRNVSPGFNSGQNASGRWQLVATSSPTTGHFRLNGLTGSPSWEQINAVIVNATDAQSASFATAFNNITPGTRVRISNDAGYADYSFTASSVASSVLTLSNATLVGKSQVVVPALNATYTLSFVVMGVGGATNLDGLLDVKLTSPASTQVLQYNGSQWVNAAAPAGGSGTVTSVTGTAPIQVASGTTTPAITITPASGSAPGSMSSADFTKLLGIATGATANATDAQLRDRATHTGTQAIATISGWGTGVVTALGLPVGGVGAFGQVVAKGTATLGTAAIASGASGTVVTVAAVTVTTTAVIDWGFNTNPNAVTGYNAASTTGCLVITCFPTAGNINFVVSNPTAASITPGALTLNWTVVR